MNRADVAVLSLRLAALWAWSRALLCLPVLAVFLGVPGETYALVPLLGFVLGLALGSVLYFRAPALARRIFPGTEPVGTASRAEIGALALQLCGVLLWSDAIGYVARAAERARFASWTESWALPAALVLTLAAGTWLVFGARSLARILFREEPAGADPALVRRVHPVAFSVLGILLVATSLPEIAAALVARWQEPEAGRDLLARHGVEIARALFGVLLFVGAGGLAGFWRWVHRAGLAAGSARR